MTKIYIDFTVQSKLPEIDFSDLILLKSTSRKIGDFLKSGIRLDYSEWSCETDAYVTNYANDVIEDFYKLISPCFVQIKERLKAVQAEVLIYFVIDKELKDNLSLFISKEMVHFCSELNASTYYDGIFQEDTFFSRKLHSIKN